MTNAVFRCVPLHASLQPDVARGSFWPGYASIPGKPESHIGLAEVDRAEIGSIEKSPEIGPVEVGPAQIGPTEIGVIKIRSTKIYAAQIGPPKIGPAKIGLTEIGAA